MNIGDGGAEAFAEGLRDNKSLTELYFDCKNVTDLGWSSFSRLLCDTSSVNNTYLSNHTLQTIRSMYDSSEDIPGSVKGFMRLNKQDQYNAPICKILMSHSELDMTPFFQWKLKLLPLVLAWFERARSCRGYIEESITSFEFEARELSAVYQFIHGLPLLLVNDFYSRKSTQAHSKKRKFDQCGESERGKAA